MTNCVKSSSHRSCSRVEFGHRVIKNLGSPCYLNWLGEATLCFHFFVGSIIIGCECFLALNRALIYALSQILLCEYCSMLCFESRYIPCRKSEERRVGNIQKGTPSRLFWISHWICSKSKWEWRLVEYTKLCSQPKRPSNKFIGLFFYTVSRSNGYHSQS